MNIDQIHFEWLTEMFGSVARTNPIIQPDTHNVRSARPRMANASSRQPKQCLCGDYSSKHWHPSVGRSRLSIMKWPENLADGGSLQFCSVTDRRTKRQYHFSSGTGACQISTRCHYWIDHSQSDERMFVISVPMRHCAVVTPATAVEIGACDDDGAAQLTAFVLVPFRQESLLISPRHVMSAYCHDCCLHVSLQLVSGCCVSPATFFLHETCNLFFPCSDPPSNG